MTEAPGRVPNGRVPGVEGRAGKFPGPSLIPALNAIQERVGWLPREELVQLSRDVRRPLYEIEGLISFYPHFRTEEPKKTEILACHDLSCWLRGADEKIAELRERHADDPDTALIERSCVGRCDSAPAVIHNHFSGVPGGRPPGQAQPERIIATAPEPAASPRWPNDPYTDSAQHYSVLKDVLAGRVTPPAIIASLKDAGLRGMGGAGFPTGRKWGLVADTPVDRERGGTKYVICNADESEPGTFKDREILATQPHLVLEGMLLSMLAVGAEEAWVFIRHEYDREEKVVSAEIARLRETGLIGPDVLGSGKRLNVEMFVSPGGYILGEESALIECMEGHRGEPRNKPPFPGTYGLHGQPTLMNSVETFAHATAIARGGADWWHAQGAPSAVPDVTHSGWKFFAVSGHVERPGVYCVPMGTTARELLDLAGGVSEGRNVGAIQPGGASSNFLGPGSLDTELDFATVQAAGSMLGSGAMVVMAEGTDLLAAATNILRFFRDESCGKCVPCRVGSTKAHAILAGGGTVEQVVELETVMRRTSICGLGQVALGPVMSVKRLRNSVSRDGAASGDSTAGNNA
jgi:formate dehydrogenase/NADH-quinone oxidoreductase subunit F